MTVIKDDLKNSFSITATPRFMGVRNSFPCCVPLNLDP